MLYFDFPLVANELEEKIFSHPLEYCRLLLKVVMILLFVVSLEFIVLKKNFFQNNIL